MATDRRIDPRTGDYVSDGRGNWQTTTTSETAVYHQLRGDKGRWWGDADAGSRFFELDRAKSALRTAVVVRDILQDALEPLVDAGRIASPQIAIERALDQLSANTSAFDLQSGAEIHLIRLLPFDP